MGASPAASNTRWRTWSARRFHRDLKRPDFAHYELRSLA
jgi:hypothetical protein